MADGWSGLAQSTSQLPALGMGMIGMKERQADRDIALGISQERLALQEQTAKQAELNHQAQMANAEAKLPKDQQVFNPSMVAMAEGATLKAWGPTAAKSLTTHLLDPLREIAAKDEKSTFGDAHAVAKSIWGTAREGLSADLSKALASGKLSPEESKKVAALLDTVQYDPDGKYVIDQGVFKNTYEAIRQREDNSPSAIEALKQEGRPDDGELSEPYQLHGATVQRVVSGKNIGKIIQVVPRAPVGEGTTAQVAKQDAIVRRIEKEGSDQARKEAFLKYNIVPEFVQNADGSMAPKWPVGRPEVYQFYENRKNELTNKNIARAVKQGALSKDYLPQSSAPGGPLPTETPAPEARKLVKDKDGNYVWQ